MEGYISLFIIQYDNEHRYPLTIKYTPYNSNQHIPFTHETICSFLVHSPNSNEVLADIDACNARFSARDDDIQICMDQYIEECYAIAKKYPLSSVTLR